MNLDTPRKVSYSKKAENFISDRFKELYTLFLLKYSTKAIPVLEFRDWVIRIQRTSEGQISNVKTFSFELESIVPLAGSKDLNLKMVDKVDKVNKNKVSKKRNRKRRKRSGANDMSKTRKK
jgi:hypothetical protein